ncbi:hypothetical protein HUU40_32520 [candidate division KSB1 bacterium]|nr:hypothetical protein [candidate division KSB1 bacterium]
MPTNLALGGRVDLFERLIGDEILGSSNLAISASLYKLQCPATSIQEFEPLLHHTPAAEKTVSG